MLRVHTPKRARKRDENLARFNMPLEIGMAMAKRFIGGAEEHDWLVLVPEGHACGQFIPPFPRRCPASGVSFSNRHRTVSYALRAFIIPVFGLLKHRPRLVGWRNDGSGNDALGRAPGNRGSGGDYRRQRLHSG
jgi:hypothetical protein